MRTQSYLKKILRGSLWVNHKFEVVIVKQVFYGQMIICTVVARVAGKNQILETNDVNENDDETKKPPESRQKSG